ncbi:MAG: right-handed parallel beta-helix repeat-containing protein [Pseudomonadota bacterium]
MLAFVPSTYSQDIIWVGTSSACTAIGTSNPANRAYPDFETALTFALISFNQATEIRLTNTVDYNLAENSITIDNYTNGPGPFSSGPLTVKGGYANCGSAQSSTTVIPQAVSVSLDSTSNESTVTISDITVQRSNATGMFISGALEFGINVTVFLENVRIDAGRRGISITNSAKVVMDSNTVIENHSHPTLGGGLYCGNIADVELNGARFENNIAPRGGQIYVDLGCTVNLREGSEINGVLFDNPPALQGAGIYVDSGFLRVWGGSDPAIIRTNYGDEGSGIFCTGTADVLMEGRLLSNWARFAGGNIYATGGCDVTLTPGAIVQDGTGSGFGGGIYLSGDAFLQATGSQDGRVVIRDNFSGRGGGLYIQDDARAELFTTLFLDNDAIRGGAIWVEGSGAAGEVQLLMDRVDCPFLISCSELQGNDASDGVQIHAENSNVVIRRTLFDRNTRGSTFDGTASGAITLIGSNAEIDRVGFIGNEAYSTIFNTSGPETMNIRHVTAVDNTFPDDPGRNAYAMVVRGVGTTTVFNSIFMDTDGQEGTPSGNFDGSCNLVDDQSSWPAGTTILGTAIFNNASGGDIR